MNNYTYHYCAKYIDSEGKTTTSSGIINTKFIVKDAETFDVIIEKLENLLETSDFDVESFTLIKWPTM